MNQIIAEVQAEDFTKVTIDLLPHKEIENKLTAIGGGGVNGVAYKNELIKLAGWKGDRLTSFARKPEEAAEVFNKIRLALAANDDPDELKKTFEV